MSDRRKINSVALIGYGYWGQKLARKFHDLGVLNSIYDEDPARLKAAVSDHQLPDCIDIDSDAVAIATPPETHYDLVKEYLGYGKHVFCEKPLATTYDEAADLELTAISKGLRLQVGFIYLWNRGLLAIPQPIGPTSLYIRLRNVGGAPSLSTRELIWAGLPHALSVAIHFMGDNPKIQDLVFDRHSLSTIIWYGTDSFCKIEVADHTGVRQRSVRLDNRDHTYYFEADNPTYWTITTPFGNTEQRHVHNTPSEPMQWELEAFLTGELITDRMGSKVAGMTDQIKDMMRKAGFYERYPEGSDKS